MNTAWHICNVLISLYPAGCMALDEESVQNFNPSMFTQRTESPSPMVKGNKESYLVQC